MCRSCETSCICIVVTTGDPNYRKSVTDQSQILIVTGQALHLAAAVLIKTTWFRLSEARKVAEIDLRSLELFLMGTFSCIVIWPRYHADKKSDKYGLARALDKVDASL